MNEETKPLWTLEQGLALARRLEPIAIQHNTHIALGGSVLHRGSSDKDLDIFVYPRKTRMPQRAVDVMLKAFGASDCRQRGHDYAGDEKNVWTTEVDGKRVDFFFL